MAKEQLTSSQLLVHYDPSLPLHVAGDVSPVGLGGVFSHVMPNGQERLIAYASRTLSSSEWN